MRLSLCWMILIFKFAYYRPRSEASEGYVLQACVTYSGGGGGGGVGDTKCIMG